MGKFGRKFARQAADTAVTARDAGKKRQELFEAYQDEIRSAFERSLEDPRFADEPFVVCLADPETDVMAHSILEPQGKTSGFQICTIKIADLLSVHRDGLAEHIGDGLAKAPARKLNVLVLAHQGALAVVAHATEPLN